MASGENKVKVGISVGDFNGIGPEVIIKTFSDSRLFDFCLPIVYGSSLVMSYNKKSLELDKFNYRVLKNKNVEDLDPKTVNIINCWEDEVIMNLGQPSSKAGECALIALDAAMKDLMDSKIDVLITAPVNKSLIKVNGQDFTGHTQYITEKCGLSESLMLMVGENIKVALVTDHIALKDVPEEITAKKIYSKLEILNSSLKKDFGIDKPKIAVLGLNPHSGDNGVLGKEEKEIIIPTIEKAQENGILAFGPYSGDGFMGSGQFNKFDSILAMYHDQGLIAFKSVSFGNGVNYTAGLPVIRTSPDHGSAFEIAGKNIANPGSFRQAVFLAIDIFKERNDHNEYSKNPLKKWKVAKD